MTTLFFLAGAGLSLVAVLWAALCWLGAIWFLASWIADGDAFTETSNRKLWAMKIAIVGGAVIVGYMPVQHYWKIEKAASLEGDLFAGAFEPETNCMAAPVQIGSAGATFFMVPPKAGQQMPPYFAPFPDAQFLVTCGKHGILVTTTVRNRRGSMVVNIERNHWTVYPPYAADKNYTKTAFEVKDDAGHVLFQIRLAPGDKKNLPRLQVQGEWWNDEYRGLRVVFTGKGGGEVIPLTIQNQHNDALIQPIFRYPSKYFWGTLVN